MTVEVPAPAAGTLAESSPEGETVRRCALGQYLRRRFAAATPAQKSAPAEATPLLGPVDVMPTPVSLMRPSPMVQAVGDSVAPTKCSASWKPTRFPSRCPRLPLVCWPRLRAEGTTVDARQTGRDLRMQRWRRPGCNSRCPEAPPPPQGRANAHRKRRWPAALRMMSQAQAAMVLKTSHQSPRRAPCCGPRGPAHRCRR